MMPVLTPSRAQLDRYLLTLQFSVLLYECLLAATHTFKDESSKFGQKENETQMQCITFYTVLLVLVMSSSRAMVSPQRALNFFSTVGKLKTLKRTGWVDHNVSMPESVADHMYRMTMLCFMITDPAVDKDRLMKICLVHDLAEATVGDITPPEVSGVSKEEKRALELKALSDIVKDIDNEEVGNEIFGLWNEYEDAETPLAKVAKQLDKYEMIVQADEYEKAHSAEKKRLDSFFKSTEGYFTHPEISEWDKLLRSTRDARWAE
jgi:putative hydrolase of HD superfamily